MVRVKKMEISYYSDAYIYVFESKSFFINTLLQSFSNRKQNKRKRFSTLFIPRGLQPYWKNITNVHGESSQILLKYSKWIYNLKKKNWTKLNRVTIYI